MSTFLFFLHSALLLVFGVILSFAFSGIKLGKKSTAIALIFAAASGALQLLLMLISGEDIVWKLYPVITHVPLGVLMYKYYKKRISTIAAAITSAYLCCQPAKWTGLFIGYISKNEFLDQITRILVLILTGFVVLRYLAPVISKIFDKKTKDIVIFGMTPVIYYIFDYAMGVYTNLWSGKNQVSSEFLPFFICIVFFIFCFVYYREYERKADAERREQIIKLSIEQQSKEIENIKKSNHETRLLRHDMRHLLNALAMSIENEDKETALNLISNYVTQLDAAAVHRYCDNDAVNYVLSDFESKCKSAETKFDAAVEVSRLAVDEVILSSMISNALDNALNAVMELPPWKRKISLMLRSFDNKLLLSVENPFRTAPVIVDGQPVSKKEGHGYGTKSIRYLADRLGGKTQFSVQDGKFVVRVIIIL